MQNKDLTIYDYRKEKERQNHSYIIKEKIEGKFKKLSTRTTKAGYIDYYIYRSEYSNVNENLPIIINLHGGGFVLGYPEQDGVYCQQLANNCHSAVINVDYALAPEFKFPIAIETTYEVILDILMNAEDLSLDGDQFSIIGHSAGGTIACALALMDREKRAINFKKMVLNYPCVNLAEFVEMKYQNKINNSNSRYLDYAEWYLEELSDVEKPYASPINSDLTELPATFILAAELDPLLNQTIQFYDKATRMKNDIKLKIYKNCNHGFTHKWFEEFNDKKSREAWSDIENFLSKKLSKGGKNEVNRSGR